MSRRVSKLFAIILTIAMVFTLSGCGKKLKTVTYNSEKTNTSISLSYDEKSSFTYSENMEDLRTSSENAILKGENFNIAIQIESYYSYKNIDELKKSRKSYQDFKEVKYNDLNGFSYYYAPYVRYEVILPLNDKYYVKLHIYSINSKDKNEDVKKLYNSDEVQEILNTVKISTEK